VRAHNGTFAHQTPTPAVAAPTPQRTQLLGCAACYCSTASGSVKEGGVHMEQVGEWGRGSKHVCAGAHPHSNTKVAQACWEHEQTLQRLTRRVVQQRWHVRRVNAELEALRVQDGGQASDALRKRDGVVGHVTGGVAGAHPLLAQHKEHQCRHRIVAANSRVCRHTQRYAQGASQKAALRTVHECVCVRAEASRRTGQGPVCQVCARTQSSVFTYVYLRRGHRKHIQDKGDARNTWLLAHARGIPRD
jgi:hypothetical protein